MYTGDKIREITRWLSSFYGETKALGGLNMHDRNIDAEQIFGRILSIVLYCNLKNLNSGQRNHPAVDLGDETAKIAVQITTDKGADKVQHTLDLFFKYNLDQVYSKRLLIMVITDNLNYRKNFNTPATFSFDRERDIWDIPRLVHEISELASNDPNSFNILYRYLKQEMESPKEMPEPPRREIFDEFWNSFFTIKSQQHTEPSSPKQRDNQHPKPKETGNTEAAPAVAAFKIFSSIVLVVVLIVVLAIILPTSSESLKNTLTPWAYYSLMEFCSDLFGSDLFDAEMSMHDEVKDVLARKDFAETSTPIADYNPKLNQSDNISSFNTQSVSFPFVVECTQMDANPISTFLALVEADLFSKNPAESDSFVLEVEDSNFVTRYQNKFFWFRPESTKRGNYSADTLLKDIIALSKKAEDGLDLEQQFLSTVSEFDFPMTYDSWSDHCYYNYYIYYGTNTAHILCVYLRTGEDKDRLTDIEFQMLNLQYCAGKPLGGAEDLQTINNNNSAQITSLIIAIEYLLTGETGYDHYASVNQTSEGNVEIVFPTEYVLGDYQVSIAQSFYESEALGMDENGNCVEQGQLITYRIRK